jgi:hypothetical protein
LGDQREVSPYSVEAWTMKEESHRDQAHRLEESLTAAADVLASISPCPFAPGRPLDGSGHFDNLSPQCRARDLRRRRPRPFVFEMMRFVEANLEVDPGAAWEALRTDWNTHHELHLYSSSQSMREAYGNAVRRYRGSDGVPAICRSCVLEDLRRRSRSHSKSNEAG